MSPSLLAFILLLITTVYFSIKLKKLTLLGAITGGLIACCIFTGVGFTGIIMIGLFFIIGSWVTTWKIAVKQALDAAEKQHGKRTASQVLANGTVPGIMGLLAWKFPDSARWFECMMAAALAAATADTISSELGTLYGKKFYNISSFQPGKRGENGVVSYEGTLLGLLGSMIIAVTYCLGFGFTIHFVWIIIAGTAGNIADSILGATLERKQVINNDIVNFLNTLFAGLVAGLLLAIF
ncbi:hypothetical protein BH11BAC3_BH11BAC3_43150 [soil metagenome]